MKEDIHPETHPVVFVDSSNDTEFVTTSTLTSDETKEIDGVEHYVIDIEITSASHPFFTGEKRFVDTEGRVDKFKKKMEKVQSKKDKSQKNKKQKDNDDETKKDEGDQSTEEQLEEMKQGMSQGDSEE
jgi:large subunit ribosomal protein L31